MLRPPVTGSSDQLPKPLELRTITYEFLPADARGLKIRAADLKQVPNKELQGSRSKPTKAPHLKEQVNTPQKCLNHRLSLSFFANRNQKIKQRPELRNEHLHACYTEERQLLISQAHCRKCRPCDQDEIIGRRTSSYP